MGAKCAVCFGEGNAVGGMVEGTTAVRSESSSADPPKDSKKVQSEIFKDVDKAIAEGLCYKVTLSRSLTPKLGMSVVVLDNDGLIYRIEVKAVQENGVVGLWNKDHADKVTPGQEIIQINGRKVDNLTTGDFNELFAHWRTLELLLLKGAAWRSAREGDRPESPS
mmetsp:Transcript_61194/g.145715  ORF Transcript_61194/g.145715 Transcript_61194/m.145715 type:complete len:165 (+) Transcript_61194:95-589(+)